MSLIPKLQPRNQVERNQTSLSPATKSGVIANQIVRHEWQLLGVFLVQIPAPPCPGQFWILQNNFMSSPSPKAAHNMRSWSRCCPSPQGPMSRLENGTFKLWFVQRSSCLRRQRVDTLKATLHLASRQEIIQEEGMRGNNGDQSFQSSVLPLWSGG